MKFERKTLKYLDWNIFFIYVLIVIIGFLAIYSVGYQEAIGNNRFGISFRTIKQGIWFIFSLLTFLVIININTRVYQSLAFLAYLIVIAMLLGTFFLGKSYGGHNSWYKFKFINLQPTEFAKLSCSLALANYMQQNNINLTKFIYFLKVLAILIFPMLIILIQGDLGSALVFLSFGVVIYREGFNSKWFIYAFVILFISILSLSISKLYLIISILFISMLLFGMKTKNFSNILKIITHSIAAIILVFGIDFFVYKILKPHQQNRIKTLFNPNLDPKGIGWNVTQSKIAIGSGGFTGKGFLKGTQTKYGFVPEQDTDFIFCTIGEEYGWLGSCFVILLFILLLNRIITVAERQKSKFERIYGYSVFSIIAFHFFINIGMTIGLTPVIGIPLPFITYGGSSLFSFSIMIFILMKMDAERLSYLSKKDPELKVF